MTEYHYAPMSGGLQKKVDGVIVPVNNWTEHHTLMAEFLEIQKKVKISETITYGHDLFHGHSGRVDIYQIL